MKLVKTLALGAALVCALTVLTGCACCGKCKEKKAAACGMACCADAKATCATCPTCTPKK
jgi:hypothetical protein